MATHPPDHAFTDMLKTARRAAASLASQASTTAEPETAARKLEKFGGDRDKLTPAQARRVRKAERRATAS